MTIDGERVDRAAKRADWAGRALESAAEDLQEAGGPDGGFEGLTEMVLDQAARVSRLSQDIESRRDDRTCAGAARDFSRNEWRVRERSARSPGTRADDLHRIAER